MKSLRTGRLVLLALLIALIPACSFAGVFISVGFAPPVLPVYVQPVCPAPGLMWVPGYWAYGPDGYYWVDGAWVPAPYVGALWTPAYWGWSGGLFIFHPGYWGPHVGYYGGVNYGYGYMGVGFVGGEWRGGTFAYNTAVMHVGPGIRNTYVDQNIVVRNTIANNNRVAFSGGPGGIYHPPTAEERIAEHEQHTAPTSFQQQHEQTALRSFQSHPTGINAQARTYNAAHENAAGASARTYAGSPANGGTVQQHASTEYHATPQGQPHPAPQQHAAPHPAPQQHAAPKGEEHGR